MVVDLAMPYTLKTKRENSLKKKTLTEKHKHTFNDETVNITIK